MALSSGGVLKLLRNRALIGGRWSAASDGATFEVINPACGRVVGHVPDMSAADARSAISAAHESQERWQNTSAKHRSQLLYGFYRLLHENRLQLAQLLTAEQGKPLAEAGGEVAYGNSFIEYFATLARNIYGDVISGSLPNRECLTIRQAAGVAALITPWNFPHAMIARKLGAALACGCCCVLKPAEDTPLTALALCRLAEEAGVPPGVINVVTCSQRRVQEVAQQLTSDPRVAVLSFTGSTAVGKLLYAQCASTVKKLSLELGGNCALIVFDSADIEAAVKGCMAAKFRNAGQTCISANRILVQAGIYEQFVQCLQNAVETQLVVGDGTDARVNIGPLINDKQFSRVSSLVSNSVQDGARVLCGDVSGDVRGGRFFKPVLLDGVTSNMDVFTNEVFGPVCSCTKFGTEEEAIRLANQTDMGLAAYIFSEDIAQVFHVSRRLQAGSVAVNEGVISQAETPIGGVKQSGVGREGGPYSVEDYTELKYLCIGTRRKPA